MMRQIGTLRPGELGHRDMQRLVDAFGPVAAASRAQFQELGVKVLDVSRKIEDLGDVVVADVAIGDQTHADLGAGVFVDDGGRDRPDLALRAFDQRAHRAGGVEHEGDLHHGPGLCAVRSEGLDRRRRRGMDGRQRNETSEHQGPRNACKHGCDPLECFPVDNVPWASRLARVRIAADHWRIFGGFCPWIGGFQDWRRKSAGDVVPIAAGGYDQAMKVDGRHTRTLWLEPDGWSVGTIDQTVLPHRFATLRLTTLDDAARAIRTMQVRGAPLIGAAAAYGMCLALRADASDQALERAYATLIATRPTAINLKWALDEMVAAVRNQPRDTRVAAAYRRAAEICDEDVAINAAIGRHGLKLIEDIAGRKNGAPVNVLTHCNAGWLATVDWGTATAPIYMAHDAGIGIHVYVDETRPRNQGASLTAWELGQHGVRHTVVADNTGGHLMQHAMVDLAIVGTDRVTAQGDVCNKIGTYLKALAAKDNGVPFYVALPSPTIDFSVSDGLAEIPIEQRDAAEQANMTGRTADGRIETVQVVPDGTAVANYAFDVTPARLISGLITERGIVAATRAALAAAFPERAGGAR
jgi:methylthioribose-1-phosphate isomerase